MYRTMVLLLTRVVPVPEDSKRVRSIEEHVFSATWSGLWEHQRTRRVQDMTVAGRLKILMLISPSGLGPGRQWLR